MLRLLSSTASKKRKRGSGFVTKDCYDFAVQITERDKATSEVKSVCCRMCMVFGREEGAGDRTRKRTKRPKYWGQKTFKESNFLSHLTQQHTSKWQEYCQLRSNEEKEEFLRAGLPARQTVLHGFVRTEQQVEFSISKPIIDVIIREMMFHPEDSGTTVQQRALALFSAEATHYTVTVQSPLRFRTAVKLLAGGASFSFTSYALDVFREDSGMAVYGGCSAGVVCDYARIVCAVTLQAISTILQQCWTFSIAFDCSTHQGHAYLDVRARVFHEDNLRNLHVIAIPIFGRHTGGPASFQGGVPLDHTLKTLFRLNKCFVVTVVVLLVFC